jgi:hypothetical protein
MSKNHISTFALLLLFPVLTFSQKQYKTPVHSLGVEVNWAVVELADYRKNFDIFGYGDIGHGTGYGGSFVFPYQYAPKSSFFGFQSGLGFFMWGTSYSRIGSWQTETESLYSIGIPLVTQFKVGRAFWLEAGGQTNFAVYNTLRQAGNFSSPVYDSPGQLPIAELQAVFGFRYHFFRSFSFKARIHYGLTPAYRVNFPAFPPNYPTELNYRYRFMAFEMGLSYLFPWKK